MESEDIMILRPNDLRLKMTYDFSTTLYMKNMTNYQNHKN